MKTNKEIQETAARQEMVADMPLTMRVLYRLGCFTDKGMKWKRDKSYRMKPAKWTITPRWYHPALIACVAVCGLLFGIICFWEYLRKHITKDIVITTLD